MAPCRKGLTKTKASKSSVPMHPLLAGSLKAWQDETLYSRPDDYVFASYKLGGKSLAWAR
jgi:hypothetical protein